MNNSHTQYIEIYRRYQALLEGGSCGVMNAARARAAELLEAQGLPTKKEERYKYTSADEAFAPDFGLNLKRIAPGLDPYQAYRCSVPNLSTALFFVVNDMPYPASDTARAQLQQGVIVDTFCHLAASHPELLDKYYNRAASGDRDFRNGHDGVTLLNTLLAQDGLVVYVPEGVTLVNPIQIVNVSAARMDFMSVRRLLIVAERGSHASILFCDHADSTHKYLSTQVAEVYVEDDAELELYAIEETSQNNTRFSTFYVEQGERTRVSYDGVTLTSGVTRNRIDVRLRGKDSRTELYGAVIADGEQRVDNNLIVEHLAPQCSSEMLYKYVLDGQSMAAFAGKVYVAHGAQKTESIQTNANLCASPQAHAFSQPMLEVYADDVKCDHGSTVGKLDESALLYMRQRGIPESEARLLLQHAFINEVLRHVRIEHIHDRLGTLVDQRFRGELKKCRNCAICK